MVKEAKYKELNFNPALIKTLKSFINLENLNMIKRNKKNLELMHSVYQMLITKENLFGANLKKNNCMAVIIKDLGEDFIYG